MNVDNLELSNTSTNCFVL